MGCRRDRAAGEADAQQCRGVHGQGDRGTQECTAIQTDAHRCTVRGEVLFWTRSDNILPRGTPQSGAAKGPFAVSARGSGCDCLTGFIAYSPSGPAPSATAISPLRANPSLDPVLAGSTGVLDSTGLCVHTGQGSLPICAANESPIWPLSFGLARELWLKNSVGTGRMVRWSKTYIIQYSRCEAWQPSVLHDSCS